MARTTFSGPVKSDNGFEGNITGDVTGNVTATDVTATGTVIFSGLPTSDPNVAGAIWSNTGVLNVSAG
jgi:cytoskeletal protein CcmA (bactofilin family)